MARSKKSPTPWMARQGDVLLRAVPSIPDAAKAHVRPNDRGRVILAYGEVTGHSHALAGETAVAYGPSDDAFWLEITGPNAAVTHDEHTAIVIPPDVKYVQVIRQREYSDAGERRVQD